MDPQRLGHFMVAVGIEGEELIVHDPGKTHGAFLRYSLDDFDRSWRTSNRSALVVHDDNNAVSWHPNDSLIKVAGDPRVYLLIGGSAFWIFDEDVFNAHNFDWQRILTVSQRELSCYQYGGEISWEPYREVFQVNSRIYLMERQSADSESCAYYQFSSEFSFNTWKIPGALRNLAEPVARAEYYNRCNFGGVLYSRAGTLIKPSFDLPGYGSGVIFFVTGNGELMPFDGWEVFNLMGYSRQVYWLANEEQFNSSVSSLGQMISMESASQCLMDGLLSVAGVAEVESTDSDGDGSGIEEGDCDDNNARIFPGAEEVCDGLDNDCDGAVDVGSWCPADCSCVNGQCTMILDEEEFQIPNENPPEEPAESLPEEAIDDEEPESEEEPVEEEEVSLPEEESPALENPPEEEVESAENVPEEAIDDEGVEREEENEASDEIDLSVRCTITCPAGMRAYAWYSADKSAVGNPAVIDSDIDEICLRGNSWIDFNCACIAPHEWSCYDWRAANVSCNHEIDIIPGQIDPRGEGEIWFRDFQCFE
ncbi:putative metal-binding motif-containing protein [Patescibacteria group bacterium]|nr:putative metal-binding motif-containing protein [Patescibacteria group bacterium]